jgi:predicted transcriptional regulator
MKPYIQKQPKHVRERIEAKLDDRLVAKLEKYCRYLDSDRDYVISQALEIAFRKDLGFLDWLAAQSAAPEGMPLDAATPPTQRGRKPGRAGASGDRAAGILPETGGPALETGRA